MTTPMIPTTLSDHSSHGFLHLSIAPPPRAESPSRNSAGLGKTGGISRWRFACRVHLSERLVLAAGAPHPSRRGLKVGHIRQRRGRWAPWKVLGLDGSKGGGFCWMFGLVWLVIKHLAAPSLEVESRTMLPCRGKSG